MVTETHLAVAYKLLRCRDAARKLYGQGAGWNAKQAEWRPIIQAVMKQQGTDQVLHAAITLGQQLEGISLMTCLGVCMEMLEADETRGSKKDLAENAS